MSKPLLFHSSRNARQRAIEELRKGQQELREYADAQIASLEKSVQEQLRLLQQESTGEDAPSAQGPAAPTGKVPPVRPGDFSGMTKYEAIVQYFRDRPGAGAVELSAIRKALMAGGLKLSERIRRGMTKAMSEEINMINAITVSPHHEVLGWDEKTRTVWLKSLAHYVPPRRRYSRPKERQ